MANPTAKVPSSFKMFNDAQNKWFFVGGATNAKTYQNGQMVGTPIMGASKAGYVTDFDDSKALIFLGLLNMPSAFAVISSTTADNTVEAFMKLPQWINMPLISGTASRALNIGNPVYAVDAGHVTLSASATTFQNLVGWVMDVDSGAGFPAALTGPNVWILPVQYAVGGAGTGGPTQKQVPILFNALRKPADYGTVAPNAGTSGILGVVEGTYGTTEPTVKTFNAMGASTSNGARFQFPIPVSYPAGSAITLVITAGMSVVASVTSTLQVDAYRLTAPTVDVGPGSGATQSINSTTLAAKTFTITATNVIPGDILDVRVQININDGGSTPMNGIISAMTMNLIA